MASNDTADESQSNELLSLDEAVELLKSSRATVYRWLRSGALKGHKSGRQWRVHRQDLERFLRGASPRIDSPPGVDDYLETLSELLAERDRELPSTDEQPAATTAVLATTQLALAWEATQFSLEPHADEQGRVEGWLRMRIDGPLKTYAKLDARSHRAVIEGWKRWAACDPHVEDEIQYGRAVVATVEGRTVDFRLTFMPTIYGESVSIAVVDPEQIAKHVDFDRIDYTQRDRERIDAALAEPWGLTLVTGPTGSGKSTFLYAALTELASPQRETIAIEDGVEWRVPSVVHVPIDEEAGVTFSAALRAALHCDPDVVMVGEQRDRETLDLTLSAALAGHVVLTALHAPDALAALSRMFELGLDPGAVGEAVRLIVAQRLVRRLCTSCAESFQPDEATLDDVRRMTADGGASLGHDWKRPVGCPECAHTGYRGRRVISETLLVTDQLARALRDGADPENLRKIALADGMTPIAADGIERASHGETTLDEVRRVLGLSGW